MEKILLGDSDEQCGDPRGTALEFVPRPRALQVQVCYGHSLKHETNLSCDSYAGTHRNHPGALPSQCWLRRDWDQCGLANVQVLLRNLPQINAQEQHHLVIQ